MNLNKNEIKFTLTAESGFVKPENVFKDTVSIKMLEQYLSDGLIRRSESNCGRFYIWKYTPLTEVTKKWDQNLLQIRSLVTDKTGKIIARSLDKFFNYEEFSDKENIIDINKKYQVANKLDGVLINITKIDDGELLVNSNGSFTFEAIAEVKELIERNKIAELFCFGHTYIFEYISPNFPIIVNYNERKDLHLIAIRNVRDGSFIPEESIKVMNRRYYSDIGEIPFSESNLTELKKYNNESSGKNHEGFIIILEDGQRRVKLKSSDYKRLAYVRQHLDSHFVFDFFCETYKDARLVCSNSEFTKKVAELELPDEVLESFMTQYNFYKEVYLSIFGQASILTSRMMASYNGNKKEIALYLEQYNIKNCYKAVVFALLDGKNYDSIIKKNIKPKTRISLI